MSQDLSTHRYRFLVAGEIIFTQADSDTTHSVRLNTMLVHTHPNIPARLIGRAQQMLQLLLIERMKGSAESAGIAMPQINVHDVVIYGVSHLGYMSEEEFTAPPEGTVKQEKTKPVMSLVPANDELHIITGAAE